MRIAVSALCGLLAVPFACPAHEVIWKIEPTKKSKLVFEAGKKRFNWDYRRHEAEVVSSYSADEKRWMKAAFPGVTFRLFKGDASDPLPDEYAVLPDRRVVGKDDWYPIQPGTERLIALACVVRSPDGLVPPETPPAPGPGAAGPPARRTRPGELAFVLLEDGPAGATVLTRGASGGMRPDLDVVRFRSFPLGRSLAFELADRWGGATPGETHARYRLYLRHLKGVNEAWAEDILDYRGPGSAARVVRFALQDVDASEGDAGEPELLVREETLSKAAKAPDPAELLPPLETPAPVEAAGGLVRIHQLRSGRFRLVGWADRAQGDRPVAMRKNWPNYLARRSQGPSVLLSFSPPTSPFDTYLCPWPDHPAREVPWVAKDYVYKGREHRTGDADLRLAVWFLHDPQGLYLVAVVQDDRLVLPSVSEDPGAGDHLQLWLDPLYGTEPFMLEIFPGSPPGAGSSARVKAPEAKAAPAQKVRVAARFFGEGYWLEAAIPYGFLDDMGVKPTGSLWGVAVNAVDVDEKARPDKKTVLSTSKAYQWAKPETFNNLILE